MNEFQHRPYGLGSSNSQELLEDSMIGSQYVPISLRVLDAGDREFMKEMDWKEPQYRLWLKEVENEDDQAMSNKAEYVRDRKFDQVIMDDPYLGEPEDTTVTREQLCNTIDRLTNGPRPKNFFLGQHSLSPIGPPVPKPLTVQAAQEMSGLWSSVQSCHARLYETRERARSLEPQNPSYMAAMQDTANAGQDYISSCESLLRIVDAVATSSIRQGVANGIRS